MPWTEWILTPPLVLGWWFHEKGTTIKELSEIVRTRCLGMESLNINISLLSHWRVLELKRFGPGQVKLKNCMGKGKPNLICFQAHP